MKGEKLNTVFSFSMYILSSSAPVSGLWVAVSVDMPK